MDLKDNTLKPLYLALNRMGAVHIPIHSLNVLTLSDNILYIQSGLMDDSMENSTGLIENITKSLSRLFGVIP